MTSEKRQTLAVLSAWVPWWLAEAVRVKAFQKRCSKSEVVRTILLRELGEEAAASGFDVQPPIEERNQ